MVHIWNNKEKVMDEARKYSSRTEFKNNGKGAYYAAHRYGWINEMEWLKSKNEKGSEHKKRRWKTKEDVIEESKKYNNRTDFKKKSCQAYKIANKNKWLDEMVWITNSHKHQRGYWLKKENVINESKKYHSKIEFQNNNTSAYQAALKHGWIGEMTWLVKQVQKPYGYWKNKENVIHEAKKYTNISDFRKKSATAYQVAKKEGYLNELIWLKKKQNVIKKTVGQTI